MLKILENSPDVRSSPSYEDWVGRPNPNFSAKLASDKTNKELIALLLADPKTAELGRALQRLNDPKVSAAQKAKDKQLIESDYGKVGKSLIEGMRDEAAKLKKLTEVATPELERFLRLIAYAAAGKSKSFAKDLIYLYNQYKNNPTPAQMALLLEKLRSPEFDAALNQIKTEYAPLARQLKADMERDGYAAYLEKNKFTAEADALRVLMDSKSTDGELIHAAQIMYKAYTDPAKQKTLESVRLQMRMDLLGVFGDSIPKTAEGIANIRKELKNNPQALAIFNAWLAYVTGGNPTRAEIDALNKLLDAPGAREAVNAASFWVKLVYRQELLAPYENMTLEEIAKLQSLPEEVIKAAKEIGMWAPGLYQVNYWIKLKEIEQDVSIVSKWMSENVNWQSRHNLKWSDIPKNIQEAVKRLFDARDLSVDISWGGGLAATALPPELLKLIENYAGEPMNLWALEQKKELLAYLDKYHIPTTEKGLADLRAALASDPAALAMFEAYLKYKTGAGPFTDEIAALAKTLTGPNSSPTAGNLAYWLDIVRKQEVLAPYNNMTIEQLQALGSIPEEVLKAARDMPWATDGLYQVKIWMRMQEIKQAKDLVEKYITDNNLTEDKVYGLPLEVLPQNVRDALMTLTKAKDGNNFGHDINVAGHQWKAWFTVDLGDKVTTLIDAAKSVSTDGIALIANLIAKVNGLIDAINLIKTLMSRAPNMTTSGKGYAALADQFAKDMAETLGVILGKDGVDGLLKQFTEAVQACIDFGFSDTAINRVLGKTFDSDIDGDGAFETGISGILKEITGLVAGPGGLLDKAIEQINVCKENYARSQKQQERDKIAFVLEVVFGTLVGLSGFAGNAAKLATTSPSLRRQNSTRDDFLKWGGDVFYTVGGVLGAVAFIGTSVVNYNKVNNYLTEQETYVKLTPNAGLLQRIRDKIYDLAVAYIDLYEKIAGDLKLGEKISGWDTEKERSGDWPDVPGFMFTYWVKKDHGYYTPGARFTYELHGVRGELPKKPENYGNYS